MSRRKSKIISFLLTVIMIFNTMPTEVFAINLLDMDTKIDCTHQHDEDCGYVEAVEGAECTHTDENDCDHMDDCGYMIEVDGSECNHECNEDCVETETPSLPVSCVKTEGCTLLDGHDDECSVLGTISSITLDKPWDVSAEGDATGINKYFGYTYDALMSEMSGTGTESDPFLIRDFHDLLMINVAETYCDTEDTDTKKDRKLTAPLHYLQTKDIDLSGTDDDLYRFFNRDYNITGYITDGSFNYAGNSHQGNFEGSYDGGGYSLIGANRSLLNGGLSDCTIKNLTFKNANLMSGGIISSANYNKSSIENVHLLNSTITNETGSANGFIGGTSYSGLLIDRCSIDNDTTIEGVGSVNGFFSKSYSTTRILNSSVDATLKVSADSTGNVTAGGLASIIETTGSVIENCSSSAKILLNSPTSGIVGGLIYATSSAWNINNSTFSGTVSIHDRVPGGNIYIGGLIGKTWNDASNVAITNSVLAPTAVLPKKDVKNKCYVGNLIGSMSYTNINNFEQIIPGDGNSFGYANILKLANFNGEIILDNHLVLRNTDDSPITHITSNGEYLLTILDSSNNKYTFNMDEYSFVNQNMYLLSEMPTPTKEGCKFGGWYDNSEFIGNQVSTPQAGKTYFAKWVDTWEECTECSEEIPHMIHSTADLDRIRNHQANINGVTTITGYFKLDNDIVFTEEEFEKGGAFYNDGKFWEKIGDPFTGYFDGNGYSIENVKMDVSDSSYRNGFFGKLQDSVVKNLTLKNPRMKFHNDKAIHNGSLAGSVDTNAIIENCHVVSTDFNKYYLSGGLNTGGLVGYNKGTIRNCSTNIRIDGGFGGNGGLVGVHIPTISSPNPAERLNGIYNCNVSGLVTGGAGSGIGGIVGKMEANAYMEGCSFEGELKIPGDTTQVGTFASSINTGAVIRGCFANAEVSTLRDMPNTIPFGNFVGKVLGNSEILESAVNLTQKTNYIHNGKMISGTIDKNVTLKVTNSVFRSLDEIITMGEGKIDDSSSYAGYNFSPILSVPGQQDEIKKYYSGEVENISTKFISSDSTVATASNEGVIISKKVGTAEMTAKITIMGKEYTFGTFPVIVEPIYITFGEKDGENPNGTIEYPFTGVAPAFSNYAMFYPATVTDGNITITPDSKSVDLKEGTDIVFIYNRGDGEKEYTSLPVGLTSNDGISVTVKLKNPNYRFVTKSNSNPSDTISEKVIVTTNEKQEVALKGIIEPTDDTLDYTGQGRSPVLDLDKISADGIDYFTVHFQKVDSETEYENTQIENKPAAELTNDAILAIAPSNVGEYVMIITGTGDTTYVYSSWKFAIVKRTLPTGKPSYTPITTSGKTLNDAALNVGTIIPKAGSIKWVDNNGQELDGNTKVEKNMAYKWLFSPTDSKNYTDLTGSITLWESSTGGGESGGSTPSNPPRVTPDPINPAAPTIATINVDAKVSKEKATVILTEKSVDSAIKKAQNTAKKSGSTNGIAVEINANTGKKTVNELQVAISKSVQEKLLASGVKYLMIKSSNMDISMDSNTLKQLQTTLNGDVNVVSKKVDATKLSAEAKKVVGSRPVIEISITNDKNQKLTNLNQGQISIAIPFTLEKNEKIGQVFGVYLDPNGKVEWLTNSVYNVNDGQLEFTTNHLSTFGVAYQTVPQLNDIQNHWAKDAIEFVTSRGLMSATSGNFQPDAPVTRGMMAMALGKLANVDVTQYKQTRFSDVQNDQNFGYYEWISEKNIMAPANSTTFSANQTMSREEVAVTLSNYLKAMNDQLSPVYVDIPFADEATVSTAAQASVKQLRMAGVLSNKEKNRFDPKALATRAQTAIMLQRFIERSILETSAQGWQMNDSGKWQYYEAGKAVTKSQKIGSQLYTFDQYGITATQPKRLMVTYIVKDGDSLKTIAKAQNCSVSELARINNKTTYATLKTGEMIKVYA